MIRVRFEYVIDGCGVRDYDNEFDVDDPYEALKLAVVEVAKVTPMSAETVASKILGRPQLIIDDVDINEPVRHSKELVSALLDSVVTTEMCEPFIRVEKKQKFEDFLSRTKSGKKNRRRRW